MKKTSLLNLTKTLAKPSQQRSRYSLGESNSGFTLIELIVVVVFIGVLAAIAGPSWFGFVNQRRVGAANDIVFRSLQEAQSEAKKTKLSYSVSLKTPTGEVPQIAVHQGSTPPADTSPQWKSLSQEQEIKPGQIWLGTNVTNPTGKIVNGNDIKPISTTAVTTATFDYRGLLQSNNPGLIIAVAAAQRGDLGKPIASTGRCVKVITLIGSMQAGRIDPEQQPAQCNPI